VKQLDSQELTLLGSYTSPYVRKLRMYLVSQEIPYTLKRINYLTAEDSEILKRTNPINKIPVLLVKEKGKESKVIYDSRVIFGFLVEAFGGKRLNWEEENILSSIDGLLDTSINLFSLQRAGLDTETSQNSYLHRQWERLDLILDALLPWVKVQNPEKDWNFLNMSLYSFLDWGVFRGMISLDSRSEYRHYMSKFQNLQAVKETEIPK